MQARRYLEECSGFLVTCKLDLAQWVLTNDGDRVRHITGKCLPTTLPVGLDLERPGSKVMGNSGMVRTSAVGKVLMLGCGVGRRIRDLNIEK